jgi:hypothetical protein
MPASPEQLGTVAQQPEPLEWLRQVGDAHSVLDMSTGARVLVPKLQLLGAAVGSNLLVSAPPRPRHSLPLQALHPLRQQ